MRLASLLVVLALVGCAGVDQLNPTPNVLLARSAQSLGFSVGDGVQESFKSDIDRAHELEIGPGSMKVGEWRETLTNGFRNSIARFFEVPKGAPALTLVVVQARPWLEGLGRGTFRAHVQFQAELLDAGKKIVKTWSDTTASRNSGSMYDADILVRSALEAMFEEIANGMPVPASPPPSPPVVQ